MGRKAASCTIFGCLLLVMLPLLVVLTRRLQTSITPVYCWCLCAMQMALLLVFFC